MKYDLSKLGICSREIFLSEKEVINDLAKQFEIEDEKFISHVVYILYNSLAINNIDSGAPYSFKITNGITDLHRILSSKKESDENYNNKIKYLKVVQSTLLSNYRNRNSNLH